jgi:glutamyl-tRNA reductase
MVSRALGDGARAMTLIDVSLPRNINPDVRDVPGARLVDIDALGAYVASIDAEHAVAIPRVEEIVGEEMTALATACAARTRAVERPALTQSA